MKIKIVFTGTPFIHGIKSGDTVEVNEGISIRDLLLDFHVEERFHLFIVAMVNGECREPSTHLKEKDELSLFLPVSGG